MNKQWTRAAALLLAAAGAVLTGTALADDDDDHERHEHDFFSGWWWESEHHRVEPVTDEVYRTECGGCHFAYPPGLLPAVSWQRILDGLDDHFGDNAELMPETRKRVADYLRAHAADRSDGRLSRRLARGLDGSAPIRITELPYIRHEHREIPRRYITGNPDVRSLSQCNTCHRAAAEGNFTEESVQVPGLGRWDD